MGLRAMVCDYGVSGGPIQSKMACTLCGVRFFFGDFSRWHDVRQRDLAQAYMKIICKVCEKFVSLQFGIIQRNEP